MGARNRVQVRHCGSGVSAGVVVRALGVLLLLFPYVVLEEEVLFAVNNNMVAKEERLQGGFMIEV